jgi:hypothetical protein
MAGNFDSLLRIKSMALKVSPYVCTGNHIYAMFAHKNYGCVGFVDDPLPNIASCLHCVALLCI